MQKRTRKPPRTGDMPRSRRHPSGAYYYPVRKTHGEFKYEKNDRHGREAGSFTRCTARFATPLCRTSCPKRRALRYRRDGRLPVLPCAILIREISTAIPDGGTTLTPEFCAAGCTFRQSRAREYFLNAEGVAQRCALYIGARHICDHDEMFLPLHADITDGIADGEAEITFVCTSFESTTLTSGSVKTTGLTGSWFGSNLRGIWGDISLEILPQSHISDLAIRCSVRRGEISVLPELSDAPDGARMHYEVLDGERAVLSFDGGCGEAVCRWTDAQYWDTDHPKLYRLRAELVCGGTVLDSRTERFGFLRDMDGGDKIHPQRQADKSARRLVALSGAYTDDQAVCTELVRVVSAKRCKLRSSACRAAPAILSRCSRRGRNAHSRRDCDIRLRKGYGCRTSAVSRALRQTHRSPCPPRPKSSLRYFLEHRKRDADGSTGAMNSSCISPNGWRQCTARIRRA